MDLNSIQFDNETMQPYVDMGITFGIQILTALLIFVIGKMVAKMIKRGLVKMMIRAKLDETLVKFLANIAYGLILAFVIIAALSQMGVQTASLAAVIAAAGLAVGLALQGSLSNFASGVLLILFRPFKVGDYVEAGGVGGTIIEVSILTTIFRTPDNKRIIVPNRQVFEGSITNFSALPTRRMDLVIGVGYDDDIQKVKKTLEKILSEEPRVLKDPAWTIGVLELADSSVNFAVRPWVNSGDFWPTRFDLMEKIKVTFDKEDITIPYPQRDLHIKEGNASSLKAAA